MSNSLPPFSMKLSFPSKAISSSVSTQSEANPGHIIKTFFFPIPGRLSSVLSVYGCNHSSGPNRDWKVVSMGIFIFNFSVSNLVVL